MPDQSHKQTPYDQFNFEIPQKFPEQGVSAAAANAIVNSETWTDANPMLNLSSFVTTYCEPEAKDLYDLHMFRNFADP
jgi:glutamate decarboxylase